MKAVTYHDYGPPDVLALEEIDVPVVGDDQVLLRVHATSVNPLDWHFLTGAPAMVRLMAGLRRPRARVLGIDVAGRVEAIGRDVTRFQPGDEVFGSISHGGFAEYTCAAQDDLVWKPARLSFEQAAAVPAAGRAALQGLRDHGRLQSGQHVLINGASGGVGTFAVQIAKSFGAQVTGVCSTRNLDMVRTIGADHVIDYTTEDLIHTGQRYDLIFDVVAKRSFAECRCALAPNGVYVTTAFSPALLLRAQWIAITGNQSMVPFLMNRDPKDLPVLSDLLEAGTVSPVIDRCYTLSQVPEALQYLGQGHARGKIVITVE
jgi:NADPH:quinone reductase-like Zn-dependent oxidoreductase